MYRAVAASLKVVRRRKPASAEGTRGESTRALSLGGLGGLPRENFWVISTYMCVFNSVFMHLGP